VSYLKLSSNYRPRTLRSSPVREAPLSLRVLSLLLQILLGLEVKSRFKERSLSERSRTLRDLTRKMMSLRSE